jgi:hypothetical protein
VLAFCAAILAIRATRACAQDDAHRLLNALQGTKPAAMLDGFTSITPKQVAPNTTDAEAGIIGVAGLVFAGPTSSNVEIRYAVFVRAGQAKQYGVFFSEHLGGQQQFLPYLPDAICAANSQMEVCGIPSGNVFVGAIARGVAHANTHDQQVIRGVSAAQALQYALLNLKQVRDSIGQSPAPQAAAPTPNPNTTGPCALLTAADAAAVMRSRVMSPTNSLGTCFYGSQSSPGDGVALQLIDGGRSKFDFDQGSISNTRPLNGLGDAAFEFFSAAGFVQVYVVKGNHYFEITLTNSHDRALRRSAYQLARQIVAKLPST